MVIRTLEELEAMNKANSIAYAAIEDIKEGRKSFNEIKESLSGFDLATFLYYWNLEKRPDTSTRIRRSDCVNAFQYQNECGGYKAPKRKGTANE